MDDRIFGSCIQVPLFREAATLGLYYVYVFVCLFVCLFVS